MIKLNPYPDILFLKIPNPLVFKSSKEESKFLQVLSTIIRDLKGEFMGGKLICDIFRIKHSKQARNQIYQICHQE